jgi:lariat debranching enzyme
MVLFFRYHGGWLAPNIYFLGAAGSIYINPTIADPSKAAPIRLSGMSGIYKSFDYKRGHFETVPFNEKSVKSAYHVREYDVLKLKQVRTLSIKLERDRTDFA